MEFNLINSITIVSIFQAITLSVVYFFKSIGKNINYLLSALFFIYSLQILFSLSINYYSYLRFTEYFKLFRVLYLTALLLAPILYFIVLNYYEQIDLNFKNIIIHFAPFFISECILIVGLLQNKIFISMNFTRFLILLQSVVYIVLILNLLRARKILLRDVFRVNLNNFDDFIKIVIIGYIVLWFINIQIFGIIKFYTFAHWCAYVSSLYALVIFIFITSLLFIHMLYPGITHIKYSRSSLCGDEKKHIIDKLTNYVCQEESFKDPELTLEKMSFDLEISTKLMSRVLNETFKMNFNEFLNFHRIEEAKKIMGNKENNTLTILEILYMVGFGSKSAFYSSFKKLTGYTPTEFRKKNSPGS